MEGLVKWGSSTILDLSSHTPAGRRPGTITKEILETLLGPLGTSQTAAPGTHAAHYAPHTSLLITDDLETELQRLSHLYCCASQKRL